MNKIETKIVIGIDHGDEGKTKILYNYYKTGQYNLALRFNGSSNRGGTIYHNNKKFIVHLFPIGVVLGIKSIIGPGCVVNEKMFFEELEEVTAINPDSPKFVKIAHNAHVVQASHLEEELCESKIGTTKRGIGPAYRDKYARIGIRAESINSFKPYLVDVSEEFYNKDNIKLLCEGAQAMGLDIDWGEYPFVTSSHCGIGSVINNGVPISSIKSVEGVIKAYSTYVGAKQFQDINDPMLDKICELGSEFGATTGRRRQVQYLDLNLVKKFALMNSINVLHVNKMDILRELKCWKVILDNMIIDCATEENFKEMLENYAYNHVKYYYSPE